MHIYLSIYLSSHTDIYVNNMVKNRICKYIGSKTRYMHTCVDISISAYWILTFIHVCICLFTIVSLHLQGIYIYMCVCVCVCVLNLLPPKMAISNFLNVSFLICKLSLPTFFLSLIYVCICSVLLPFFFSTEPKKKLQQYNLRRNLSNEAITNFYTVKSASGDTQSIHFSVFMQSTPNVYIYIYIYIYI